MNTIEKAVLKLNLAAEPIDINLGSHVVELDDVNSRVTQRSRGDGAKCQAEQSDSVAETQIFGNDAVRQMKLPLNHFKAKGMISADAPKSQIAEEYRAIKRPLLSNMDGGSGAGVKLGNVIMVTSCVEGEGKTFSAINLAMSLAMERDKTVLLIDADAAKGTSSRLLGFRDDEPGLTNLLLEPSAVIDDFIWQTDMKNLFCLPAGRKSEHSTELMASNSMRELIRKLAEDHPHRIIVFDAPPVLETSEAVVMTQLVGQIAFIIAAESTTQGMVSDALNRIQGSARIGLMLNKTRKKFGTASYGYGYGYGHDHRRTNRG